MVAQTSLFFLLFDIKNCEWFLICWPLFCCMHAVCLRLSFSVFQPMCIQLWSDFPALCCCWCTWNSKTCERQMTRSCLLEVYVSPSDISISWFYVVYTSTLSQDQGINYDSANQMEDEGNLINQFVSFISSLFSSASNVFVQASATFTFRLLNFCVGFLQ